MKTKQKAIPSVGEYTIIPSDDVLLEHFQNGHIAANNGAKFALCKFCGLAQGYWQRFQCSRIEELRKRKNKRQIVEIQQ